MLGGLLKLKLKQLNESQDQDLEPKGPSVHGLRSTNPICFACPKVIPCDPGYQQCTSLW